MTHVMMGFRLLLKINCNGDVGGYLMWNQELNELNAANQIHIWIWSYKKIRRKCYVACLPIHAMPSWLVLDDRVYLCHYNHHFAYVIFKNWYVVQTLMWNWLALNRCYFFVYLFLLLCVSGAAWERLMLFSELLCWSSPRYMSFSDFVNHSDDLFQCFFFIFWIGVMSLFICFCCCVFQEPHEGDTWSEGDMTSGHISHVSELLLHNCVRATWTSDASLLGNVALLQSCKVNSWWWNYISIDYNICWFSPQLF